LQIAYFGGPKTMSVGDQDHGRIAMPVPARFARRRHQLLDLGELRASSLASVSQANVLPRRLDADQCTYATSGHPVVGGITPKLVEVVMMPSHTADETAKRPLPVDQREKDSSGGGMIIWRWRLACCS